MRQMFVLSIVFAAAIGAPMAAQGQQDGVSITVSRQVSLPATEAQFFITIVGDQTLTLDGAIAKLKDLGVTANDFAGVNFIQFGPPPAALRASYQFRLMVPMAKIRETNDKILQIRRTETEVDVQGAIQGIFASPEALESARQRLLPELLREARRRAEELEALTQLKPGKVLGFAEPSTFGFAGEVPMNAFLVVTVRFALE